MVKVAVNERVDPAPIFADCRPLNVPSPLTALADLVSKRSPVSAELFVPIDAVTLSAALPITVLLQSTACSKTTQHQFLSILSIEVGHTTHVSPVGPYQSALNLQSISASDVSRLSLLSPMQAPL